MSIPSGKMRAGWGVVSAGLFASVAFGQKAVDPASLVAKIRENARTYIDQLATLTCTENTRQTIATPGATSTENREDGCDSKTYKLFAVQALGLAGGGVNLKQASSDWNERLKEASLGAATGFLAAVADPKIDAAGRWMGMGTERGRTVAIFSFRVPAAVGYELEDTKRMIRVAYNGRIYADPETGNFVRVEMQCVGIPGDSEYEGAEAAVDFRSFEVNGKHVELPSHSIVRFRMKKGSASNEAEYSAYRLAEFGTNTEIRFGEEATEEKQ